MIKTCITPECGAEFQSSRSDARYCSPKCRAKASRRRAKGETETKGEATVPQTRGREAARQGAAQDNGSSLAERPLKILSQRRPPAGGSAPDPMEILEHGAEHAIHQLQNQIQGLSNAIKGIRLEVEDLRSRADKPGKVESLQGEVEELRRTVERRGDHPDHSALKRRLTKLEDALPSPATQQSMDDDLSRLSLKTSRLERSLRTQEEDSADQAKLKETVAEHDESMMTLAKRVWALFKAIKEAGVDVEFGDV